MSRRSTIAATPGLQGATPSAETAPPPRPENPGVEGVPSPRRHHFYRQERLADQEAAVANKRRIAELETELETRREMAAQEERNNGEREQREELESGPHGRRVELAGREPERDEAGQVGGGGPGRQSGPDGGQQQPTEEGRRELEVVLACPNCGQVCKNKAGLSAHKRFKHPPQE